MARPNVILIVSDGHRWDGLGYAGHPDLRTPNLDALASHGVCFSQAVSACPDPDRGRSILWGPQQVFDRGDLATSLTLPRLLGETGYLRGAVGRMGRDRKQLESAFDVLALNETGAYAQQDDYHAWLARHGMEDRLADWARSELPEGVLAKCLGAVVSNLPAPLYSTTWTGDQALRFTQHAREPFLLVVSFCKPAFPYDPPRPWHEVYAPDWLNLPPGWTTHPDEIDRRHFQRLDLDRLTERRLRRIMAHYYAGISQVDHQVGRLLATLAARGFTNNLFIYTSTRGDYLGYRGLVDVCPRLLYEPAIRVPLLIAGLSGQRRGDTDPALATLADIAPTILDACGAALPDSMDGASLLPCLKRRGFAPREWALTATSPDSRALRGQRYKLLRIPGEAPRFYDLHEDPLETTDLHGQQRVGPVEQRFTRALSTAEG